MTSDQKLQLAKIGNSLMPSAYDVFALSDLYRCIDRGTPNECLDRFGDKVKY